MRSRWMVAVAMVAGACGDNLAVDGVEFPEGQVLYEGAVWGPQLAIVDGAAYFVTYAAGPDGEHALVGVSTAGDGDVDVVWQGAPGGIQGYGLAHADGELFWSGELGTDGSNVLRSVSLGARGATVLGRFHTTIAAYAGVSIANDIVYGGSFDEVIAVPRDGGEVTTAFARPSRGEIRWSEVDADGVLYVAAGGAFSRVVDGVETVLFADQDVSGFVLGDRVAYLFVDRGVVAYPLRGGAPQRLDAYGTPTVAVVDSNAGYLYAAVTVGTTANGAREQELMRIPLYSGTPLRLATGLEYVGALALDGGALYLTQCACSQPGFVGRIDLPPP